MSKIDVVRRKSSDVDYNSNLMILVIILSLIAFAIVDFLRDHLCLPIVRFIGRHRQNIEKVFGGMVIRSLGLILWIIVVIIYSFEWVRDWIRDMKEFWREEMTRDQIGY